MFRTILAVCGALLAAIGVGCGDEPTSPDRTPPALVSDLAVAAVTDSSVTLTWTAPGDDGDVGQAWVYDLRYGRTPVRPTLEVSLKADSLARPQEAGAREQAVVSGLVGEDEYYFGIRTADEMENWSAFSAIVFAHTTADTIPPSAVADLTAVPSESSYRNVVLSWTAPGDSDEEGAATSYQIRYSEAPLTGENWEEATLVKASPKPQPTGIPQSLEVEGFKDLTTYYFGLKSVDDGLNWSALSNIATVMTRIDDVPPTAVDDLEVVDKSHSSVTLAWTAPGDDGRTGRATSYDVRYAVVPVTEADWSDATPTNMGVWPSKARTSERIEVTRLDAGHTYHLALKTADDRGNTSPVSNSVVVTLDEISGIVWHVLPDGSGDAPTIQAGIDSASVGDTVLVAPGTYYESIDFKGKDIVVMSSAGPKETVIRGTPEDAVVSLASGEGSYACLEGFRVTGGLIGIWVSNSEPILRNNHVTGNSNRVFGAGIHCYSGATVGRRTPLIIGNRISSNSVGVSGAGIFSTGWCSPIIRGNLIDKNHAGIGDGGGIYMEPNIPGAIITENKIQRNHAGDKGGGIFLGGIYGSPQVEVSDNLILFNRADGDHVTGFSAGAIAVRKVDAWVHNNTIFGSAGYGPGGHYGGGIGIDMECSPVVERNIIAFTEAGGAIRCLDPSTPTIRDNLVWESVGGHGSGTCEDWVASYGNIEADPQFCDLGNGDYTVAAGSPALTHPAGPLGAFPTPGCSAPPANAQTWNGIRALYRP